MFTSIHEIEGEFRVIIEHPSYNSGAPIQVTGYSSFEGAQEGAAQWDTYLQSENPPAELVCITGSRHVR